MPAPKISEIARDHDAPRRENRISCAARDADHAVAALYAAHYRSLVRLAALLVPDTSAAEEIVQDSFAAMHSAWHRLADTDLALCYLRRSVVRRSRSAPKRRGATAPQPPVAGPEGKDAAFISALWTLPPREREVVVLRYFADLPTAQVASAAGLSNDAVKTHTARAMSALQAELHTS